MGLRLALELELGLGWGKIWGQVTAKGWAMHYVSQRQKYKNVSVRARAHVCLCVNSAGLEVNPWIHCVQEEGRKGKGREGWRVAGVVR